MHRLSIAILVLLAWTSAAQAANDTKAHTVNVKVNEAAKMSLLNTAENLTITATEAGAPAPPVTSSVQWLRYTSIVEDALATRRSLTARITAGWPLPAGTRLDLACSDPTGNGTSDRGVCGTPQSAKQLTNASKSFIIDIGSCRTGTGPSEGSQLTYTFSVSSWNTIRSAGPHAVTVTFTLTEDY